MLLFIILRLVVDYFLYHKPMCNTSTACILMILLQKGMVSPGTHLVKSHESRSRTNESQFKNNSESDVESAWAFM